MNRISSHLDEAQIYVCDWIPPEFGAVGQYTLQRAHRAAQRGGRVVIIGLGRENEQSLETVGEGQLTVVRLGAKRAPKESFLRRAFWSLTVNARLMAAVASELKRMGQSTILVTGSPPLLSYLVLLNNALFWRSRIIYRITDFYPEVAFAAGKARWLSSIKPLFHSLRRTADTIEVLGEDQRMRLHGDGVPPSRISLFRDASPIEDWSNLGAVRRPFSSDYRVLLYSGNLGVAHDTDTLCEAYRRHIVHGANRVRLWINGTGVRVADVQTYCAIHGLPLAVTAPVPLEQLVGVLKAADAHLITLGEGFWGYVLPSKIYACLEAGQPILFIGPAESDVHLLASKHADRYWRARPGDVDTTFRALEEMSVIDPTHRRPPSRLVFQDSDGEM